LHSSGLLLLYRFLCRLPVLTEGLGLVLLVIALTGCKHADREGITEEEVATESISKLREAFNTGDCQSIYAEADSAFRSQSEKNWIGQCARLRESLGTWESFRRTAHEQESADPRFRLVIGEAVFTNGTYHLEMLWTRKGGRLCYVQLGTDSNLITIPPVGGPRRMDVPPLPPAG
jgi:hypothetical protein